MSKGRVVVLGGGAAGIAAALAAARAGVQVTLLEREGSLGGMGSNALVHTFCGLYQLSSADFTYGNEGLARELPERLIVAGVAGPPKRMGNLGVLPHDPSGFATEARRWIDEHPNIHLITRIEYQGVRKSENNLVTSVLLRVSDLPPMTLPFQALVDASGDAVAAHELKETQPPLPGERLQRSAYIAELAGVPDHWLLPDARLQIAASLVEGIRQGSLPAYATGASFRAGRHPGQTWCTLDLPQDPSADEIEQMDLLMVGEKAMLSICQHLSALTNSTVSVSKSAEQLGVRESRRCLGRHILTGQEILTGTRFPDAVANVTWPLELRETATGPVLKFPAEGTTPQIPAGSLRSRNFENLFFAGKCISADHPAQAAIRVMGMCFATGEAAGKMAAHYCHEHSS